jgi:hypothetical protein
MVPAKEAGCAEGIDCVNKVDEPTKISYDECDQKIILRVWLFSGAEGSK